ncbi:MAG: TlpA family protein disulfide reductase [Gammaproteobacteria bacterium]
MNRRSVVTVGVAAVAAATGIGWALRHQRRQAADDDGVWALRFERPEGGELVMADLRGRPLVLNFWATWCPPCIKEMPELDRFHREFAPQGWQVVGLAIDGPTPVRDFLRRVSVGFAIGLAGLGGTDLVRRLGNAAGGLPFSVIFGRDGQVLHRKLGETSFDELAGWARNIR